MKKLFCSLFLSACGLAAVPAFASPVLIDFEHVPGADGVLGTADDVPTAPTFLQPLDQLYAALGSYGSTSTLTIACMIFALLLVNGICYVFLLHVIYHVILSSMGFKLGAVPGFVRGFLLAGAPRQQQHQQ